MKAIDLEAGRGAYDEAVKRLDECLATAARKEFLLCRRAAILELAGKSLEAKKDYARAFAEMKTLPPERLATPALKRLS
jgi:hypothetical protein